MVGARGDALDWAVALARAPGERHALRQRPLPDGIEPLLQIAAGRRGEVLQEALARSGEPEAELVEAVRFYLREVLFHADADAYRLLGLAPGASAGQIKAHHRLLQQWLHPDRHGSDWDAIFAGRVNAAWDALRSPERRAAYDAAHPPGASNPTPPAAPWVAPRVRADAPLADDDNAARWRRRAPVLALFAACAVLGVAAVRDALREPESRYAANSAGARGTARASAPVALRLPPPAAGVEGAAAATSPRKRAAAGPRLAARPPSPATANHGRTASAMPTLAAPAAPASTAVVATPAPPALRDIAPVPRPPPAQVPVAAAASPLAAGSAAVRLAPMPAPVAPASAPIAGPGPVAAAMASPERVQQAQRTGRELLAFLAAPGARLPPIWDSLAAQQRAVRLRDSLQASGETRAGDPQWRVEPEDAALQAVFGDHAQVRAQLVWREQRWLVSGVALERAP